MFPAGFFGVHQHDEQPDTPREKALRLLLELNLELRRPDANLDKITHLKWKLCAFKTKDLISAFDEFVDKHGWAKNQQQDESDVTP